MATKTPTPTDYYKLLGIGRGATQDYIKSAFRFMAKAYHPDRNPGPEAAAKFAAISEAYEVLSDPDKRKRYDDTGSAAPTTIASKAGSYQLDGVPIPGDVAEIYKSGPHAVKVTRTPGDSDLLENEVAKLKLVSPPKEDENNGWPRYFPRLVDSFKVNDGSGNRQVNVTKWLGEFYSLTEVRKAYPNGVSLEAGVWMFNRVLEAIGHLHREKGLIHGAITPDHIMINPDNHGAKLIGFSACVKDGEKVKIASPWWIDMYAPEILAKKPVSPSTDIYMAAKSIMCTMGAIPSPDCILPYSLPAYFRSFMGGCIFNAQSARPQDAWVLHAELKDLMEKNYGPRKWTPFHMPARA